MATLRIYTTGDKLGPSFTRKTVGALFLAAEDAATAIEEEGRKDIASAGNFGARWTEGLHAKVTRGGGNIRVSVTHDIPYWTVHQFGATIRGRPLLWIPLPDVPRDYRGTSTFFQTSKRGNLLLFEKTGARDIRPLRVAKEQVTIPKRFHVIEIAQAIARRMQQFFNPRF